MKQFLVVHKGSRDGRPWAVIVPVEGGDRNITGVRLMSNPGTAAPEPEMGAILTGCLARNPAHTGTGKDGQPREFADSFTLYVNDKPAS